MGVKKLFRNRKIIIMLLISTILLFSSINVIGLNIEKQKSVNSSTNKNNNRPYNGQLRVYIVEPISRWYNADSDPYHFGFLDFAINEELSIELQNTYTKQVTWDASEAGYSQVSEKNIMAIATVFNPIKHKKYSYSPNKNPFDAYYVDATAGAEPGETGENIVNEDFTHTVFCEEGTATWCGYCPEAAEALESIYNSNDYPFYFVALISNKNDIAEDRLFQDYNIYGYPTCYIDGGYKVVVGAQSESTFRNRIESCGKRDVHELDLSISVEWNGSGILDINVEITNNEEMPNGPPEDPIINGPLNGKAGVEQRYIISAIDPEDDDVYYCIDWGDGTEETCIGPYSSGEEVIAAHTWENKGEYTLRVKAKDIYDLESDWTIFEISMPRIRAYQIQNYYSIIFIILQRLFG